MMKIKFIKIISFSLLLLFYGLAQVSDALNYSNNINIHNELNNQIAKKSGGKKSGGKKSGGKKSGGKKSGGKKSGENKMRRKKEQTSLNKIKSNNEDMRDKAKERYQKWIKNKKKK